MNLGRTTCKRKMPRARKLLRRRKAPRIAASRRKPSIRERCGLLLSWIAFVNGRQQNPPEAPPALAQSERWCADIRSWATTQLALLTDSSPVPFQIIEGPPPRWMIAGSEVRELEGNSAPLSFIRALRDGGADRVGRCPDCKSFFVKLNTLSTACGRKCSNRTTQKKWYKAHQAAERKRKREEYEAKKERERRLEAFRLERDRGRAR